MNPELLAILVCPRCKNNFIILEEETHLECTECHRRYPIEKGIPILLKEKALPQEI